MIAVANGDSLLPDVEDWMDRDDDDDEDDGDGGCVDGPGGNFVAFPQQAFRIMVRSALWSGPMHGSNHSDAPCRARRAIVRLCARVVVVSRHCLASCRHGTCVTHGQNKSFQAASTVIVPVNRARGWWCERGTRAWTTSQRWTCASSSASR